MKRLTIAWNLPAALRWAVRHAMHLVFVGMIVYFMFATTDANVTFPGRFGTPENLLNILNQNFAYFILGIGMTLVIISGGIDLSVGSVVALCGVVATSVLVHGGVTFSESGAVSRVLPSGTGLVAALVVSLLLGLTSGGAVGLVNGWAVTRFRIPPFIATLGWFMMARGLAYKLCAARPIGNLPEPFTWLGQGQIGPTLFHTLDGRAQKLWFPVLVSLLLAVVVHLVLTRTVFGRHLIAVGGNEEAARLSGVRVTRHKLTVYALNGLLAGLCGILLAARLGAGDPKVGVQPPLELGAITAVVLGGASLTGGKGSIAGTMFGAVFMGVLDNGLQLEGMQYFDQLVIKGLVLLVAVLFDQLKERLT